MKQHITIEQLKELNEDQRKKLDKYGDGVTGMLTIGDMIQFLSKDGLVSDFPASSHSPTKRGSTCVDTETLCDELWEEVVKALERNALNN